MRRLRLDIAYDGTAFSGWAVQSSQRTVQGALEAALEHLLHRRVTLTCAGRTDAGVHARGQVAHVDVPTGPPEPDVLARGLRAVLPDDVTVRRVSLAPDGFDARFSALSRRYRYVICDDPMAWDPLRRNDVVLRQRRLDLDAMNAAAAGLLGEHDFAALCKQREGGTTIRRLLTLGWTRDAAGLAVMEVSADAFCHSMVRSLVGLMLPVGEGRQEPAWAADVVVAGVRDPHVTVMPPHGLVLEEVLYPPDAELAARQEVTRSVRSREG